MPRKTGKQRQQAKGRGKAQPGARVLRRIGGRTRSGMGKKR
jgi:hypothetical protein